MLFLRSLRKIAPRACTHVFKYNVPQIAGAFQSYSSSHGLDKAQIKERVIELLECFDKVNQEKLNAEAHFKKDLGLDSLDTVEVLMALEEEFQLEIPDHDADEIKTVKDMIEYISLRGEAI